MMAKVLEFTKQDGSHGGWIANCPACGWSHLFDQRWTFNGDVESPTFAPSMLVHGDPDGGPKRCHSYLRNGVWEYLSDCEHGMPNQCVPVPDWEA